MFERFIRLAKARKALQEGRLEAAIQAAQDPLIADDRRAAKVRQSAQEGLLERARQRRGAGELSAALLDVDKVLASGDSPAAASLAAELRAALAARETAQQAAQQAVDKARHLAEHGQLAAAEEHLAAVPAGSPQAHAVGQFVAARRQRAGEHAKAVAERLQTGDIDGAMAEYQRLRALDGDLTLAGAPETQLRQRLAALLAAEIDHASAADAFETALQHLQRRAAVLPAVTAADELQPALRRLADGLQRRLARSATTAEGLELARRILALPSPLPGTHGVALTDAAAELAAAADLRAQGRLPELAAALQRAADRLSAPLLRREAESLRQQVEVTATALERARACTEKGDLTGARAELTRILEAWPMHAGARKELELIDASNQDRERRLAAARDAAREGRLREASSLSLGLVVPGAAGDEPRLLLKDVRARQDLVTSGLDQVRASLHGRQTATAEGVRHCLLRLQELAKIQHDHPELPATMVALQSELDGLAAIDDAAAALRRGEIRQGLQAIEALAGRREQLLTPERLDARLQALGDQFVQAAETAVQAGRLADVELCSQGLQLLWHQDASTMARIDAVRERAATQRQRAEELLSTARSLLDARDVDAAERCLQDIRQSSLDLPGLARLEAELQRLRRHQGSVQRVETLARERDFDGANRRLAELPPTPPMLRTRIFDMKQSLAKAQGLDGAFVLRVDEGGEYVVLRGETVSIGNVRDGRADLAILANIAGRHASIRRSMSFHGGMQDTVVADGGEVRIGNQRVDQQVLRSGDRIQLGPSLKMDYRLPSNRSLTAALTLLGSFQVAGTDRVLLFKDRGRDGRILMSAGKDGHVQVTAASGEVELFALKTGQMRVRCDAGGSIDGRPFKGEHPVDAGAMVQAAGISFVLLPLQRHA